MPGCTVPRCSNSSQKGFKLYHFPADPERCALWVKNCGREEGWVPTRHTCICEVHFESSQFELHRADGLIKLRPYAVPTKFDHETTTRRQRRKKNDNEPKNTSRKPTLKENSKQSEMEKYITTFSLDYSASASSEIPRKQTNKHRRKIVNSYRSISTKDAIRGTPKVDKCLENNRVPFKKKVKSTRIGPANTKQKHENLPTKDPIVIELHSSDSDDEAEESQSARNANTRICFMCNSRNQTIVPKSACTETSRTHLKDKIVQLVSVEFDLLVQDVGPVCINCAQILNCIDYIESVHNTLSKGILNCMKQRFCMEPAEHVNLKLYMKSLKNLSVFYPWRNRGATPLSWKNTNVLATSEVQHVQESNKSPECVDLLSDTENEDHSTEDQENVPLQKRLNSLTTDKKYECKFCSFETKYKALMIYHFHQHFQKRYTCDFCSIPVDYNPSPAKKEKRKRFQKKREYERDKSNKIPPLQFSKFQIGKQGDNSGILGKRKRKSMHTQESHKNVKRSNNSQEIEDVSGHLALNAEDTQNQSVIVSYLTPMEMAEVTSLKNMNENGI